MLYSLNEILWKMSYIFKMTADSYSLFSWHIINMVLVVMLQGIVIIIEGCSIQVKLLVRVTMLYIYVLPGNEPFKILTTRRNGELSIISFCLQCSSVFQMYKSFIWDIHPNNNPGMPQWCNPTHVSKRYYPSPQIYLHRMRGLGWWFHTACGWGE